MRTKNYGIFPVLVMGCLMQQVQASPLPMSSAHAGTVIASINLGFGQFPTVTRASFTPPKSSAAASSSKSRATLTLAQPAHSPKTSATAPKIPSAPAIAANSANPVCLARVTAYWPGEPNGDYYTNCSLSSTGAHLQAGYCAVDPKVIPYGSVVSIAGLGHYLAVDTGSAVVSRQAARGSAKTPEQKNALVIDIFFANAADGEKFAATGPQYAAITWGATGVTDLVIDPKVRAAHRLFEQESRAIAAWVLSPGAGNANAFASVYP